MTTACFFLKSFIADFTKNNYLCRIKFYFTTLLSTLKITTS